MRLPSLALPSLFVLSCLGLTGCAGFNDAARLPDASAVVEQGHISGSHFGGHLPIGGSRVFMLQAVANQYGYGSKATSLIASTVTGAAIDYTGSPTTNPTYGMYYVPSATDGSFNISSYSCSSGDPVYIYGSGGTTNGDGATTVSLQQATLATDPGNSSYQIATITVAASTPVNFVAGEPVTLTNFPTGTSLGASVLSTPLSATQFAITLPTSLGYPNGTYTTANFGTTATAAGFSGNNPQITGLAMMGLCPGTPNEFSNISYIYMNEVSTVATAEAMAGFAGTATTGVTLFATNFGAPSSNLLGLQNAALNANQLYDIQGSNVAPGTNGGGDAHVARPFTPAGNGIVPQTTLDTLGNILAACVDSANTYNPYALTPAGTQSSICTTLFSQASSTGGATGGTAASDTAIAAFNIAHLPAGASATSSTFMTDLFALQGTSYPFGDNLTTQPNDFSVAIQYPLSLNPAVSSAESIGIDASDNVWMNSHGNNNVFEFSPLGVLEYQSPSPSGYNYGYVSVDPSGNVWTGTDFSTGPETEFTVVTTNGTQTVTPVTYKGPFTGDMYDAYPTVTNAAGNAFIGALSGSGSSQGQLVEITASGVSSVLNAAPVSNRFDIAHSAVDGAGYVWLTTENGSEVGRYSETSGARSINVTQYDLFGLPSGNGLDSPEMPAVDAGNNLWVANQHLGQSGGSVMKITGGTGTTAGNTRTFSTGNQDNPFGTAVDGLNHIFVTNRCNTGCATSGTAGPFSSILEFDDAGDLISPANNYTLAGQVSNPLNIAVDGSGVIWLTSYDSSMVTEVLGLGAPTVTPLSYASGSGGLGARP